MAASIRHFFDHAVRCGAGVFGGGDWAADDQIIRAGFERFPWSGESLLIVSSRPGRADPRGNQGHFLAVPFPEKADFVRTGNQSIDSRFSPEIGETNHLI
jgi:hypothetical protein